MSHGFGGTQGQPGQGFQARLTWLGDRLEKATLFIGAMLMGALTLTVLLDVILREVGSPVDWMQDLTRFIFMWAIFLGVSIGIRQGSHYNIDLVPDTAPKWIRKSLQLFSYVCQVAFALVLLIYGAEFANMGRERVAMPSEFPIVYQVISIPISAVFMLYYLIEAAGKLFGRD